MTTKMIGFLYKINVLRILLFALIWWALTDGEAESWRVGLPTVFISVFVSMLLTNHPPNRWKVLSIVRFMGFFASASVRGGIDVARRAFHPRMPLKPDWVNYPLKLKHPSARLLLANTISLLPGTLSADLQDNQIKVHVLDSDQPILTELQALESAIGALFRAD